LQSIILIKSTVKYIILESAVSGRVRKESIWVKMYIVVLFLCGIWIWFYMQSITQKQETSVDIALDKKIVNILITNGVVQDDILNQYTRERNTGSGQWNEFYRTIKVKADKTIQALEIEFKSVARSMKVDLNKIYNADDSIAYKFYLLDRDYSNITFVNSRES
jgi:hypothetical protein